MIALVFALNFESGALRHKRLCSTTWNLGVTGERAAAALEMRLRTVKPHIIVHAGFGGGLQPQLEVGAFVVGVNRSDSQLVRILRCHSWIRFGDLVTSDDIVETQTGKSSLGETTGALAVDCESEYIQKLCALHQIPLLSIRCISDTSREDLPVSPEILINPGTGKPDPVLLARFLALHPKKIPGMLELIRNARFAQRCLANGISQILPELFHVSRS